jgi:hypothetical protein
MAIARAATNKLTVEISIFISGSKIGKMSNECHYLTAGCGRRMTICKFAL